MKRIMAIDYGDARTGIAISDLLCSLVGSTTVIHSRVPEKTIGEICRLAREQEVGQLVMASPGTWTAPRDPGRNCTGFRPGQLEEASRPAGPPVGRAPDHH